ncbi:hypothetical protein VNO77_22719 [Canavalia gladiata]|uniref:Transmembrane protein n=1 Tax=Canavalia gladiata TaxID=3824 RepID=A0AAN9L427_CANGL
MEIAAQCPPEESDSLLFVSSRISFFSVGKRSKTFFQRSPTRRSVITFSRIVSWLVARNSFPRILIVHIPLLSSSHCSFASLSFFLRIHKCSSLFLCIVHWHCSLASLSSFLLYCYFGALSAEEDQLWNIVGVNSLDFTPWTIMIEEKKGSRGFPWTLFTIFSSMSSSFRCIFVCLALFGKCDSGIPIDMLRYKEFSNMGKEEEREGERNKKWRKKE